MVKAQSPNHWATGSSLSDYILGRECLTIKAQQIQIQRTKFIASSLHLFSPESGKIFPWAAEVRTLRMLPPDALSRCSSAVESLRRSRRLKVEVTAAAQQDRLSQRPLSPVSKVLPYFIESFCPYAHFRNRTGIILKKRRHRVVSGKWCAPESNQVCLTCRPSPLRRSNSVKATECVVLTCADSSRVIGLLTSRLKGTAPISL